MTDKTIAELVQGLEDMDTIACRSMKEYDGVCISRVPEVYHGYRAILAIADGLKNMISRAEATTDGTKEGK